MFKKRIFYVLDVIIIHLKRSHSLYTGVTVEYFLHIARRQVHIVGVTKSRSLEQILF